MPPLTIRLFGKSSFEREGQAVSHFHAGKLQELFCYLLLQRDRPFSREALAGLFWGDCTTVVSKKYLRQALWQLQGLLSVGQDESNRVLRVDCDSVGIDPGGELWLDVDVFEKSFAGTQNIPGHTLSECQATALSEAVRLYRGDLLEGWYQEWCLFQRERLQNLYLAMLDKLMSYCEVHHLYPAGLEYGERVLCLDRAHERTHQRMLRLLYLSGDRAGALRQYERCVKALSEELDVKPTARTLELRRQVRTDCLDDSRIEMLPAHGAYQVESTAAPGRSMLPDILNQLRSLQEVLESTNEQLQQSIHTVERSLRRKPVPYLPQKRNAI
jgi:DNA-binding SARP family transcriptional activator